MLTFNFGVGIDFMFLFLGLFSLVVVWTCVVKVHFWSTISWLNVKACYCAIVIEMIVGYTIYINHYFASLLPHISFQI